MNHSKRPPPFSPLASYENTRSSKTESHAPPADPLRPHVPTLFSEEEARATAPQSLISEINMTPLVDVMLVLLIVFMVTLPVINSTLNISLPKTTVTNAAPTSAVPPIDLAIDTDGRLYWNQVEIDQATLVKKIQEAAALSANRVYLRADRTVQYERIAQIIALAQQYGLTQLGFVTLPAP